MGTEKKLGMAEFTVHCIRTLRSEKSKGIHYLYSGFYAGFKDYFGLADALAVRTAVDKLVTEKVIVKGFAKGGPMLYLPGEAPERSAESNGKAVLKKLGLAA